MKHLLGCVALTGMLVASTVEAQDTVARSSNVQIGIGASVNVSSIFTLSGGSSSIIYPIGFMNILIPISFQKFRLEPELGIYAITNERTFSGETSTDKSSIMRLGLAAHYVHAFGDQSQVYVGPRFALYMSNSTNEDTGSPTEESSWTDMLIGASVGGEYLFTKHFSLGAEVQLNYISHGDPEETPAPTFDSEESGSIISNNATLILRWYFN